MPLPYGRMIHAMMLITTLVQATAHGDDMDKSRDGYTFVIDDLMWLVILIVGATLIIWLCCCMDPMFDSTSQYCCKQYNTSCAPHDPVIHVKISPEDSRRQYSIIKNQQDRSLAQMKSSTNRETSTDSDPEN